MKERSMIKKQLLIASLLCFSQGIQALVPLNLIRPFNPNFFPVHEHRERLQIMGLVSTGFATHGQATNSYPTNVLQTLYPLQDSLSMLKGFPVLSQQAQLGQQINIDDQSGVRGLFKATGDFHIPFMGSLTAFGYVYKGVWLGAFLPLISMKMNNVQWEDLTQNLTLDDALTHQLLTNNLATNVALLGDGLSIGDWQKTGVGDLALFAGWRQGFYQDKRWLKEVRVNIRLGLICPTGVKKNEDIAVSLPFGNDGAFSIPFAAGLDLRFRTFFWAGVDVTFMQIFNNTRVRRIQTDTTQTNLLLLQKTNARRDYGLTQMYNLYFEPIIYKGLSFRAAYENIKHGQDKLYILSNNFSSNIANGAVSLQEWTTHDFFLQLKLDTGYNRNDARYKPQFMLFAKLPFNGKRSLQVSLVGFEFTCSF